MFKHFADQARRAITNAQDEARELETNLITPECLMLGVLKLDEGLASSAMDSLGIDKASLEADIRSLLVKGKGTTEIRFSDISRQVIENTLREALQLNSKRVQIEHLLLALVRYSDEELLKVFAKYGLGHKEVINFLSEYTVEESDTGLASVASNQGATPVAAETAAKKESVLDHFGVNLTQAAIDGKLDPVIGREKETLRVMQILSRRGKNNPILIGSPGVGKTAIVEGLAQAMLLPSVPKGLKGKLLYTLDLASVVAGARYRGDFEERMKKIMKEVSTRKNIILFIDEIHTMIGAGGAEGAMDASNILKPMLARGELQTIGATTAEEFRKYFEKDAALERRFQPITVEEPSVAQTVEILMGLRDSYEDFHKVTITDDAIEAAAQLSSRYIQDRQLPDKAIDLIDEAGARARLAVTVTPPEVTELNEQIAEIVSLKKAAIEAKTYSKAGTLSKKEAELTARRDQIEQSWKELEENTAPIVNSLVIADLLSDATGIPVFKITESESTRLLQMEKELHKRVIGQHDAIKTLSRTIRRQRTGLKDPKRPIGSFIFAGPTGVGKTELAKALSEFLFSDEKALITLDMSEYSEKHTVARLFGPPPGYVGYEDGGQLTEAVRRRPFSIILLDEIEKAHPDVFDPLLQVLEEGRLTDGQGRVIDFKNTVIIMTTNLGAREIAAGPVGFQFGDNAANEYAQMKSKVQDALKENMRPEFLNRIDDVVVFPHLNEAELLQIVDIFAKDLAKRLTAVGLTLELSQEARKHLCKVGYDKALGARPLRRTIRQEIEDPISEAILFGRTGKKGIMTVDFNGTALTFNGLTHSELELEIETLDAI